MTIVQTATNSASAATVSATFSTAPTAGNTVLAFICSDNVFTVTSGGTRRYQFLSDQQFDIWEYTGTLPTTITVTPGAVDYVAIALVELTASGFDLVGTGTNVATLGQTTATAPTITTTVASDTVFACVAMHGFSGGVISSNPVWGNSFATVASVSPAAAANTASGLWVGQKTQTTAGAVGATTVTWTGGADNTNSVQLAYKPGVSGNSYTQTPVDIVGNTDIPTIQIDPSGLVMREITITVSG